METKTCSACRTVNESYAIVCRNCGAQIGEIPTPQTDEVGPSATLPVAGGGADQGAQPTPPAPPPEAVTPATPVNTDDGGFGPPPPPGATLPPQPVVPPAPKRLSTGIVIGAVAAVVVLAGGLVYFLTRGGGGGLPDEINGHARADSEVLQQVEEMFKSFEVGGMSFEVAFYGSGDSPSAMLMTFDGLPPEVTDVPSEAFFSSFPAGLTQQQGIEVNFGKAARDSSGGADFLCAPVSGQAFAQFGAAGGGGTGSLCVFKGSTIGMIFLMDGTQPQPALGVAHTVYDAVA